MLDTDAIVHGVGHAGAEFEAVTVVIRAGGHTVHSPKLTGNRPATTAAHWPGQRIRFAGRLARREPAAERAPGGAKLRRHGHPRAIHRLLPRIARRVYVNAFVPLDGESLNDLVPPT